MQNTGYEMTIIEPLQKRIETKLLFFFLKERKFRELNEPPKKYVFRIEENKHIDTEHNEPRKNNSSPLTGLEERKRSLGDLTAVVQFGLTTRCNAMHCAWKENPAVQRKTQWSEQPECITKHSS